MYQCSFKLEFEKCSIRFNIYYDRVFHGVPQSLQESPGIGITLGNNYFLPNPFQFHNYLSILPFYAILYSYLLTSRSWALLEKPPDVQLLKNFPIFYGTWRFITVFIRDLYSPLSSARTIQSILPHCISLTSILILSIPICLGPHSVLFPCGSLANILYAFHFPHSCYMPCPCHHHLLDHSSYTWQRV
jgi:hypothetical protein